MKIKLIFLAVAFFSFIPNGWAATYTYTGSAYESVIDYVDCSEGPCANYSTSMFVSGSVTTSTPLSPNLVNQNVNDQVIAFSFFDGINSYRDTDENVRGNGFRFSTDAAGQITSATISIEVWETGSSPHAAGDRFSIIIINPALDMASGINNAKCFSVGTSQSGVEDTCTLFLKDESYSEGNTTLEGTWTSSNATAEVAVPTLGEWGMIILSAMMAMAAVIKKHRTC